MSMAIGSGPETASSHSRIESNDSAARRSSFTASAALCATDRRSPVWPPSTSRIGAPYRCAQPLHEAAVRIGGQNGSQGVALAIHLPRPSSAPYVELHAEPAPGDTLFP